jgi:hypothetical protein
MRICKPKTPGKEINLRLQRRAGAGLILFILKKKQKK